MPPHPAPTDPRQNRSVAGHELRIARGTEIRVAGEGDKRKIEGVAAVYDQETVIMPGSAWAWREIIRPGAFAGVLGDDVRCLFNHDSNQVLGRTRSKTLELLDSSTGLRFVNQPPDTQSARDVLALIQRGDVSGCSFAFAVSEQRWTYNADDPTQDLREVLKFSALYDVGPVTFPAYDQTEVDVRSMEGTREAARRARGVGSAAMNAARLRLAESA